MKIVLGKLKIIFFMLFAQLMCATISFANKSESKISWPKVPGAAKYLVEISPDKEFKQSTQHIVTTEHFEFKEIVSSVYYLRVAAIDAKEKQHPFSNVSVVRFVAEPPKLLTPAHLQRHFLKNEQEKVQFLWKKHHSDVQSLFQLARDTLFKDVVFENKVQEEQTEVDLEAGRYYWRVSTQMPNTEARYISETRILDVAMPDTLKTLELLSPKPDEKIKHSKLKNTATFQVTPQRNVKSYEFIVATDLGLKRIVFKETTTEPLLARAISPGTYYWTAFAKDEFSRASPSAPVRSFVVLGEIESAVLEPLSQRIVTRDLRARVVIAWQPDALAEKFVVQLSRDSNFKKGKSIRLMETSTDVDLLPGIWFVRVLSQSSKASNHVWSKAVSFQVVREVPFRAQKSFSLSSFSNFKSEELKFNSRNESLSYFVPKGVLFEGRYQLSPDHALGVSAEYASQVRKASELNAQQVYQLDEVYQHLSARLSYLWGIRPQTKYNDFGVSLNVSYSFLKETTPLPVEGTEHIIESGGMSMPVLKSMTHTTHGPGVGVDLAYAINDKLAVVGDAHLDTTASFELSQYFQLQSRVGLHFGLPASLFGKVWGGVAYKTTELNANGISVLKSDMNYGFGVGLGWRLK